MLKQLAATYVTVALQQLVPNLEAIQAAAAGVVLQACIMWSSKLSKLSIPRAAVLQNAAGGTGPNGSDGPDPARDVVAELEALKQVRRLKPLCLLQR